METTTPTPRFNRHACMSSETRNRILDLIGDLEITENCNQRRMVNYLYGLFDGYDYSDEMISDSLIIELFNGGNTHLVTEIFAIALEIDSYPTANC